MGQVCNTCFIFLLMISIMCCALLWLHHACSLKLIKCDSANVFLFASDPIKYYLKYCRDVCMCKTLLNDICCSFDWEKLKPAFRYKMDQTMKEFNEQVPTDHLHSLPNVEDVKFEEMRTRLLNVLDSFTG